MCVSAWHHYTRLLTVICLLFCLCVVQLVALFEMVNKIAVSRQSSANCFHFVGQQQQQQPIWQAITVNITVKIYSRYTRTHSHTLTLTQWLTHCNYATQLKLKNHTPAIAHLFDFKCTIAQCVMRGGGNPTNQTLATPLTDTTIWWAITSLLLSFNFICFILLQWLRLGAWLRVAEEQMT